MIAICVGLVALAAMTTGFTITLGVWLHTAHNEQRNALDAIDSERKLSAQYMHERDVAVAASKVATDQLSQEQQLRAVAETARDSAQKRVRNELIKHAKDATEEEIDALTTELFAPGLAVVQSPKAANGRPGSDDLIDPSSEV